MEITIELELREMEKQWRLLQGNYHVMGNVMAGYYNLYRLALTPSRGHVPFRGAYIAISWACFPNHVGNLG